MGDHVRRNRAVWDRWAADYAAPGEQAWSSEPGWGLFGVPDRDVRALPPVDGRDVLELGCGTAYLSSWLAQRGARVVGLDLSPAQLATARRLQRQFALDFPLIRADGEAVPLRDACVDVVVSEYGACLWCDPYRWVPEAARVLRDDGRLIFLTNSTLMILAVPDEENVAATDRLRRPLFGLHRLEWPGQEEVQFNLSPGDWIRCLGANDLVVEDLIEIRPPAGATTRHPFVTLEWARRWPCEEIWVARRRRR